MVSVETKKSSQKEARTNIEALRKNPYPGRGIVIGLDKRGETAIQVYWIMGRSENSRNRVIVKEGVNYKTQAFDPTKVEDPSLIIYNALTNVENQHIVSNGDQTDTIAEFIKNGKTMEDALKTREYEPDEPNFTPRISGLVVADGQLDLALLSIIKRGDGEKPNRQLFDVTKDIIPGMGFCIHTYRGDGKPLPSFEGTPYPVLLEGRDVRDIAKKYWELLNKDNRVALVVKGIDLKTGEIDYKIQNALGDNSPASVRFRA